MEEFKNWLEIIYFLSGPGVVFVAYLALGQIKIAKKQLEEQKKTLRISSKRDSLKLTAEQVAVYLDKVVKLANELDKKLAEEDVTILDKFQVEFTSGKVKLIPPEEDFNFNNFESCLKEFVAFANAMESFSTFFMSGVADEEVAYLSVGSTFCHSMEKLVPILIPLGNDGPRYSAVLSLYGIWGARLENDSLEKQKLEIEQKIKNKDVRSVQVLGVGV